MNWLLIAIVAGAPVKTNLTFPSLGECMAAEQAVRAQYVEQINRSIEILKPDDKTKAFWFSRAVTGTCIPTR